MKTMLSVTTLIVMLCLVAGAVLAQSGNELFSQALLKERTEGNMPKAIKLYQAIVEKYSTDGPSRRQCSSSNRFVLRKTGQDGRRPEKHSIALLRVTRIRRDL